MPRVTSKIKAMIRIVQRKLGQFVISAHQGQEEITYPTSSNSLRAAIGKITPPIAAPNEAIPNANARLRLNQCPMTVKAGPKIMPQLIPTAKPWHKRSCQYVLHSATSTVAITRNTLRSFSSSETFGTEIKA